MFQVKDVTRFHFPEYLPFMILGVLGGLLGAFFVWLNVKWSQVRLSKTWKRVPIELEVGLIATITVCTNQLENVFLAPLATSVIHRLFAQCANVGEYLYEHRLKNDELGLCHNDGTPATQRRPARNDGTPNTSLILAMGIRFVQMTLTFGIPWGGPGVVRRFCGSVSDTHTSHWKWAHNTVVFYKSVQDVWRWSHGDV